MEQRDTITLPVGLPDEGDVVELEYQSKRSENTLSRTGEVVGIEERDSGHVRVFVDEDGEDGTLWATLNPPNESGGRTGQLSRKTRLSKPHFETHYGDLVRVEIRD